MVAEHGGAVPATEAALQTLPKDCYEAARVDGAGEFRTFFLSPMMVPIASIILIWQVLFHYNGVVNEFLAVFGAIPVHEKRGPGALEAAVSDNNCRNT